MQNLDSKLSQLIYGNDELPQFEKDPFDMTEEEFNKFYQMLLNTYLLSEEQKQPEAKKTLKNAESVESLHVDEPLWKEDNEAN